jgi:hypothetical protein
MVSDADWMIVARFLHNQNASVYQIKKLRKSLNKRAGITETSEHGAQHSMVPILSEIFRQNPPASSESEICF